MYVGELGPTHRDRVMEILESTQLFRQDEITVALEVFDEGVLVGSRRGPAEDGRVGVGSRDRHRDRQTTPDSRLPTPDSVAVEMPDYLLLGVFSDDDRLLGWAAYGPTPATDRAFDLYWIAVDRASQGTGAGSMLLDAIEARLFARGGRLLLIETSARTDYAATRGFYARRGYEEAARVGAFYAPDDDRVILTKRFPTGPHNGQGVMAS